MRIVTWNINSVRLRAEQVLRMAAEARPDVICLQETKTPDDKFPYDVFHDAGFKHIHAHGMKGYNGVAVISRLPFEAHDIHHRAGRQDCRHIEAVLKHQGMSQPIEIHCLYIPAGGDEPDPSVNDKFQHKLSFVDEMTQWFARHRKPDQPIIALGDFNIAPQEHDVWSHKQLLKVVSHTPIEVEKLGKMQQSLGWIDVGRHFVPSEEKLYSWWSYRNRDWKKSNRGRRLDHIWVTPALQKHLKSYDSLNHTRDWDRPSDHVPQLVSLGL